MTSFKRGKSLSGYFQNIRVDENTLIHIGRILNDLVNRYGSPIDIEVTSADREDTIKTSDVAFFSSENMLTHISSISIRYHNYKSPISCTT